MRRTIAPLVSLLALSLASCGSGLAGIVSSSSSSGSDSNAPPAISTFSVEDKRESPARLTFRVLDGEGDPVGVELFFQKDGEPARSITQLVGRTNPDTYASSSSGLGQSVDWAFEDEPGLSDYADGSYTGDLLVYAVVVGGLQEALPGASTRTGFGNDRPLVSNALPPASEASGFTPITFEVADSSSDRVELLIEYAIVDGTGEPTWLPATPGALDTNPVVLASTEPALNGQTFLWDTGVDMARTESEVQVRVTGNDGLLDSLEALTPIFVVDNNDAPDVVLLNDQVVLNPDTRRGIPIPFLVRDEESDPVRVVLQWRRPEQDFPALPTTRQEIEAVLLDPVARRELQICSEYPGGFRGQVRTAQPDTVWLPEIGQRAPAFLAGGLVGRELEILRPRFRFETISNAWKTNKLTYPVATLPLGDGRSALVLDRPAPGTWTLSRIELATGAVECVVVDSALGDPTALVGEMGTPSWPELYDSVLVASHVDGTWRVDRVALGSCSTTASVTQVALADGSTELGPIRGIASLGRSAAVATVGSSLIRLGYADTTLPTQSTVFDDLATPWGVAAAAPRLDRVFVAEESAGAGRLLHVDLLTLAREPVQLLSSSLEEPLTPSPRGLSFDREGRDLLVVCGGSSPSLRAFDPAVTPDVRSLSDALQTPSSLSTGRDGLLLLSSPRPGALHAAGGLEQRRTIDETLLEAGALRVSPDLEPVPVQRDWRVRSGIFGGSAMNGPATFCWDTHDVDQQGRVFLRVSGFDQELGSSTEGGTTKSVDANFGAPELLEFDEPGFGVPIAADMDGDGDSDLVLFGPSIFYRQDSGGYEVLAFDIPPFGAGPSSVADLDGNGHPDIVAILNSAAKNTIVLLYQESLGEFVERRLGLPEGAAPLGVLVVDVDGDRALDLVASAASTSSNSGFYLFSQTSAKEFERTLIHETKPFSGVSPVTAVDIDTDGDVDLAYTFGPEIWLLEQDQAAFLPERLVADMSGVLDRQVTLQVTDLNADGLIDFLARGDKFLGGPNSNEVVALALQQPDGSFVSRQPGPGFATNTANLVTAVDIDKDRDLDVVTTGNSAATAYLNPHPLPVPESTLELDGSAVVSNLQSALAEDLDRDGNVDILINADQGSFYASIPGQGRGMFTAPTDTLGAAFLNNPLLVSAGDIDADGDLDLVSDKRIFYQRSRGVFDARPVVLDDNPGEDTTGTVIVDLDQDGKVDVVTAAGFFEPLTVYYQDTPTSFDSQELGVDTSSVDVADLDQDGDLDVVATFRSYNFLHFVGIRYQESPRSFSGIQTYNVDVDSPVAAKAADLDQDGDIDVVSANRFALNVLFQEGPREFRSQNVGGAPFARRIVGIDVADVDGDGDNDIVTANRISDNVTVFFQKSPGVFENNPPLIFEDLDIVDTPRSVSIADLDGDGDLDIVSANRASNTLKIFRQLGAGTFDPTPFVLGDSTLTAEPRSVLAVDLDQDGEVDIVSANRGTTDLRIFWGGR